jgi:hypothetical protein
VQVHCASVGRTVHVVNLDPAAERFEYSLAGDVRELVSLQASLRGDAARVYG